MIDPDKKVNDISGNEIKIGDTIAFVRRGSISFGRVLWFTKQGITVKEAHKDRTFHYDKPKDPTTGYYLFTDGWQLRNKNFKDWSGALIITMHSIPKQVFEMFDSIDFTKEIPKPPKEKKPVP